MMMFLIAIQLMFLIAIQMMFLIAIQPTTTRRTSGAICELRAKFLGQLLSDISDA